MPDSPTMVKRRDASEVRALFVQGVMFRARIS